MFGGRRTEGIAPGSGGPPFGAGPGPLLGAFDFFGAVVVGVGGAGAASAATSAYPTRIEVPAGRPPRPPRRPGRPRGGWGCPGGGRGGRRSDGCRAPSRNGGSRSRPSRSI